MTDKQIIERLKTDLDFERAKRKSLQAALKAKEQECEELKEDIERWKSNFNGKVSAIEELLQQLDQLGQTIAEIKEIAENVIKKCAFYLENEEYIGYFHELSKCFSISRLEVIGNIYENPDLLKVA